MVVALAEARDAPESIEPLREGIVLEAADIGPRPARLARREVEASSRCRDSKSPFDIPLLSLKPSRGLGWLLLTCRAWIGRGWRG